MKKFDSLNSQKSKYAGNQDELKRIEKELDLINNERKEYIKNLEQKYPNVFLQNLKLLDRIRKYLIFENLMGNLTSVEN